MGSYDFRAFGEPETREGKSHVRVLKSYTLQGKVVLENPSFVPFLFVGYLM